MSSRNLPIEQLVLSYKPLTYQLMCELIPENLQFTKKVADFKTMKVRARRMARGKDQIAASKNVAADTHTHTHPFNGPFPGLPR